MWGGVGEFSTKMTWELAIFTSISDFIFDSNKFKKIEILLQQKKEMGGGIAFVRVIFLCPLDEMLARLLSSHYLLSFFLKRQCTSYQNNWNQ